MRKLLCQFAFNLHITQWKNTNSVNRSITSQKYTNCELCKYNFNGKNRASRRRQRDMHLLKHFKEKFKKEIDLPITKPFMCPWEGCTTSTDKNYSLSVHYFKNHGILEKYLSEEINQRQKKVEHSVDNNSKMMMKKRKCELCGHKFKEKSGSGTHREISRHLLNTHFKQKFRRDIILPNVSPFLCPFEGCSFQCAQNKYQLESHYFSRHGIMEKYLLEEKNPENSIEQENFDETPSTLDIVCKEKPKNCELCGAVFVKNSSQARVYHLYQKHFREKFHREVEIPKERPFLCPMNGCNHKAQARRLHLVVHYFRKHGKMDKYLKEEMCLQNPDEPNQDIQSSENSENLPKIATSNDDINPDFSSNSSPENSDNEPEDYNLSNENNSKQFSSESEDTPLEPSKNSKMKISKHQTPRKRAWKCELCGMDFKNQTQKQQAYKYHLLNKHFKEKFYR